MAANTIRPCGDCSLCCKLPPIFPEESGDGAFPFFKPQGEWCKHCAPGRGGCRIWDTGLPPVCQNYFCLWKVSDVPNPVPEEWRPDKVHAIFLPLPIEGFPEEQLLKISFDTKHRGEPHPAIATFIRDTVERQQISLLLDFGSPMGLVLARTEFIGGVIRDQLQADMAEQEKMPR